MKSRYWIGAIISILFIGIGVYTLDSSKIEYGTIQSAKLSGRKMQIKGVWVKEKGSDYNTQSNIFTFNMKDDNGQEIFITYEGARPNNFDIAESIVVKGKYDGEVFQAKEILTKCPSKYEGNADQLKQNYQQK